MVSWASPPLGRSFSSIILKWYSERVLLEIGAAFSVIGWWDPSEFRTSNTVNVLGPGSWFLQRRDTSETPRDPYPSAPARFSVPITTPAVLAQTLRTSGYFHA